MRTMNGRTALGFLLVIAVGGLPAARPSSAEPPCREFVSGVPTGATRSDCVTIEPGAGIRFQGTYCTVSFLVRATDGTRYAVTAGHCAYATKVGATVLAEDATTPVGVLAYVELDQRLGTRDTGLIRLFPGTRARARAQAIDGPHGMFTETTTRPFQIQHIGRGVGISQVRDVRTGVALAATDPHVVHAGVVVTSNDSGSPAFTSDGKAIGWITAISSSGSLADVSTSPPGGSAGAVVIRIAPALARAGSALHTKLTLINA